MPLREIILNEYQEDELISNDKFWAKEKIIKTKNKYVNVEYINSSDKSIEIYFNDYKYISSRGFLYHMRIALLQKHCHISHKLKIVKDNFQGQLFASRKFLDLSIKLAFFPPMTFIDYENFNALKPILLSHKIDSKIETFDREIEMKFLNIKHIFSSWFIDASEILYKSYSVYYWALLRANKVSEINETLKRLQKVIPKDFKPSSNIFLTANDFIVFKE